MSNDSTKPILVRSQGDLLAALRDRITQVEGRYGAELGQPSSSGCSELDRLLPAGGFRRGTLVEWLAAGSGTGRATLAMFAAREACRRGGAVVVLDRRKQFYPPAALSLGLAAEQLIVVQAASADEELWALTQSLRWPAVAAAVAWPEQLAPNAFRRLQLAAEQGGTLGLFLRSFRTESEPSWAEIRLGVEPQISTSQSEGRRWRIRLLRCRGASNEATLEVRIDDETRPVHLVAELADSTVAGRAAGAS
jgi:protein ImuA